MDPNTPTQQYTTAMPQMMVPLVPQAYMQPMQPMQSTQSTQPTQYNSSIINTQPNITGAAEPDSSMVTYIVVGVLAVVILLLLWYGYTKFVENSKGSDEKTEKDTPVLDYNLQDAIDRLEKIQNQVLKNVSQDAGI